MKRIFFLAIGTIVAMTGASAQYEPKPTATPSLAVRGAVGPAAVVSVPSISDLEAMQAPANHPSVIAQGYYRDTSSGGGLFVWRPGDVGPPDGCITIAAASTPIGRYVRQFTGPFSVANCGVKADSSGPGTGSDDTRAWRAALALGVPLTGVTPTPGAPPPVSRVTSPLTVDLYKTSLDCLGMGFDFTGLRGVEAALTLTNSVPNNVKQLNSGIVHPFANCSAMGPDASAGVYFVKFAPVVESGSKLPYIVGVTIENPAATGFSGMFLSDDGLVNINVVNPTYTISSDFARKAGAYWTLRAPTTNSGENIRTVGGFISTAAYGVVDKGCNQNTNFFLTDVSIDATRSVVTGDDGHGPGSIGACIHVSFSGHIEAQPGDAVVWKLRDNGMFVFEAGDLVLYDQNPFKAVPICEVTGAQSTGGLIIHDGIYATFNNQAEFFCAGQGFMSVGRVRKRAGGLGVFSSVSNNLIADFNFASNPLGAGWAGSAGVSYDRTRPPVGAVGAIRLAGPLAEKASTSFACAPQDNPALQFWYRTGGLAVGPGAGFSVRITYLDAGGRPLGGSDLFQDKVDKAAFTFVRAVAAAIPAPPGTASCQATFSLAATSGSPSVWVGRPWAGRQ